MRNLQSEQGITLVEVLAAITILSIAGVVIWNTFFQGFNFSQRAMSKNLMIQETNLVLTQLKKVHQSSEMYKIKSENCKIVINTAGISEEIFDHPNLCFNLNLVIQNKNDELEIKGAGPAEIAPNKQDVILTMTASEKNRLDNNINIESFLYRLKGKGVDYCEDC